MDAIIRSFALLIALPMFFASVAGAEPDTIKPASVISEGNCSPIVIDTRGNVTLNINCPMYSGARLQIRFRSSDILLKRQQELAPAFFRPTGYTWSDFQAGFHPFLNETALSVAQAFEKHRFYAVEGEFAEWREQFVRFLAWCFSNKGIPVFFSDVREWTPSDQIDVDWGQFDSPAAVILLENVHYHPDMVRDFLYQAEGRTKNLKVIVSFAPAIKALLERRPYADDLFQSMPRTDVDGTRIAQTLIKRYSQEILHRSVGSRVTSAFIQQSSTSSRASGYNFSYRENSAPDVINLWRLAALLQGWDGKTLPDNERNEGSAASLGIDETIASIASSNVELASLMATVAFFSQYEVAIPRALLTDKLKYKPETITAAVERGFVKIVETGVILDLPGMSDALLNTTVRNREVELDVARRIGSTADIGNALVRTAIEFGVYDYGALLLNLRAQRSPVWKVQTEAILDVVPRLIAVDTSPGRIGRALLALQSTEKNASPSASLWLLGPQEMRPEVSSAFLTSIKPRISELLSTETSLKETAWLIVGLNRLDSGIAEDAVANLQTASTRQRIAREEDLGKVGSFLWAVEGANHDMAMRLVSTLDHAKVRSRIEAERSAAKIGWFFEVVASVSPDIAAEIAKMISAYGLSKFDKNTTTEDLASLMWGLSKADRDVAQNVFSTLELPDLEARVREEQRAYSIGLLLLAMADINPAMAAKLVDGVGAEEFRRRIASENDPVKRGLLMGALSAIGSSTSQSLVGSDALQLDRSIEHYGRQVQMFSTMCPWCMARAEESRATAESLADASRYFASGRIGATKTEPSSARLLQAQRYEPDLLARTVRTTLWDQVIRMLTNAAAKDKTALARILYDADVERFRDWVRSSTNTSDDAYPLLAWSELEPEDALEYVRANWPAIRDLYVRTKDLNTQSSLINILNRSDHAKFVSWLNETRENDLSNSLPSEFLEKLGSLDLTPPIAAWVRTQDLSNREAALNFFRIATSTDLNVIFGELRSSQRPGDSLIRLRQEPERKIKTRIERIRDAAAFLEFVLSSRSRGYSQITVGRRPLYSLIGSPDLIAEALPCRGIPYFTEDQDGGELVDAIKLMRVLRELEFFSSLHTAKFSSSGQMDCLLTLTRWDKQLGVEFARALGREKLFALMHEWKGMIPQLAFAIETVMPETRPQIKAILTDSLLKDAVSGMRDLYGLSLTPSLLTQEILSSLTDQALAEQLARSKTYEIAETLRYLSDISPERARNVFRIMGSNWLSAKMDLEGNIHPIDKVSKTLEKIDPTLAAAAQSQISAKTLKATLIHETMWPNETLARLAKSSPQVVIDAFDEDILEKFYRQGTMTSIADSGADVLTALRRSNIVVWSAIMSKLDINRTAGLLNATMQKGDIFYKTNVLFEELARFDLGKLIQLRGLAPKAMELEALEDFKADFAFPG